MNWIVFAALLSVLAGCSMAPSTGPLRSELVDQGGEGRFSIVAIDDRVVDALWLSREAPFREPLQEVSRRRPNCRSAVRRVSLR